LEQSVRKLLNCSIEKRIEKKVFQWIGSFDLCIKKKWIKHGTYFQDETFVGEILQAEAGANNRVANREIEERESRII